MQDLLNSAQTHALHMEGGGATQQELRIVTAVKHGTSHLHLACLFQGKESFLGYDKVIKHSDA